MPGTVCHGLASSSRIQSFLKIGHVTQNIKRKDRAARKLVQLQPGGRTRLSLLLGREVVKTRSSLNA